MAMSSKERKADRQAEIHRLQDELAGLSSDDEDEDSNSETTQCDGDEEDDDPSSSSSSDASNAIQITLLSPPKRKIKTKKEDVSRIKLQERCDWVCGCREDDGKGTAGAPVE